jgi:hypothetical protein
MRMFIDTKIIADWRDTGNAMTGNTGNVAHRAKAHDNGAGPAASIAIRSPRARSHQGRRISDEGGLSD